MKQEINLREIFVNLWEELKEEKQEINGKPFDDVKIDPAFMQKVCIGAMKRAVDKALDIAAENAVPYYKYPMKEITVNKDSILDVKKLFVDKLFGKELEG